MMRLLLVVALLALGCKDEASSEEEKFIVKELGELEKAVADRDETKMTIGCTMMTTSLRSKTARMPPARVQQIEKLCYVDVPRILLEKAIADVNANNAAHKDLGDLNCMQLFAGDAIKTLKKHPSSDPELQKLVAEYTRLCPAAVAKIR